MAPPIPKGRQNFEIAIVCALPAEADAVIDVFDDFLSEYGSAEGDSNSYTAGVLGEHNVIVLHMPGMGNVASAGVAGGLRTSFPNIRLVLIVGICGGMPETSEQNPIFLGDLIISTAVLQCGFGRHLTSGFVRKDTLEDNHGRPNPQVRGVLRRLESRHYMGKFLTEMKQCLQLAIEKTPLARHPGEAKDLLYDAEYVHQHRSDCQVCLGDGDQCELAQRLTCEELGCKVDKVIRSRIDVRDGDISPKVHLGRIGSGNAVIRSARLRNEMARKDDIIALEMEGAGLWDHFPCIIVKAVSDYADSHKTKEWRYHAAAVAAAGAKALLKQWSPSDRMTNPATVFTPSTSRSTTFGSSDSVQPSVIFNNHGSVSNQVGTQQINGDLHQSFTL